MRVGEVEITCPHCGKEQIHDTEMETGWCHYPCEYCNEEMFVVSEVEISAEAYAGRQPWMKQAEE